MDPATYLPILLGTAWLLPLASFTLIVLFGPKMGTAGRLAGGVATAAIVSAFVLSAIALFCVWLPSHPVQAVHHGETSVVSSPLSVERGSSEAIQRTTDNGQLTFVALQDEHPAAHEEHGEHSDHHGDEHSAPSYYAGDWYTLGEFGSLKITIGYYIDALTVAMFCMVTLIASCIHFYATGYMHDELHDVTDHEVTLSNGQHLHRRGRYHRFFQYFSLFCFSMLGIVIAGNVAMVFVFWELVGICSYFLIGFYIERKSASNAANKAFIVNRVGDFGMIIGLMALFGSLGTFAFGDVADSDGHVQPGIFSLVRPAESNHQLIVPDGMVQASAGEELARVVREHEGRPEAIETEIASRTEQLRSDGAGYWLLVIAGLGIFCGCVGKSAQFPLQTWLPDAMEGPTPVSALVHSATMVAAGVYLVGRFYPVFTPEVLLVIAYIGCITLFIAATIAITATDIKRVLAYSTVSQLGYMMLALGVGGWLAGVFHLFTHAFFKSLLFLCSGSVIHAVHTNEMPEMGGLIRKMPWTAYTMLFGCLAIIGAGIPFVMGFSGYYSKDSILAQAYNFGNNNPTHQILFLVAAGGAAMTAFYMFRLWYMTFLGEPRDKHRYDHAHESPRVMVYPLILLAAFALGAGWTMPGTEWSLTNLLEQARPLGTHLTVEDGTLLPALNLPAEHLSHADEIHVPVTLIAFSTALSGLLLATVIYAWRLIDPGEIRETFKGVYRFLINKWWFDELYNALFVQPTLFLARRIAQFDRVVIDGIINGLARLVAAGSRVFDLVVDRGAVDGAFNVVAYKTWNLGVSLHRMQTGQLRQYVLFIVVATVALFVLVSLFWDYSIAG